MGGLYAEGDDPALRGDRSGAPASFSEFIGLADDVIGCQHEHKGIAITLGCKHSGNRDRRTRIEHDVGFDTALA